MATINIDALENEIAKRLADYAKLVNDDLERIANEVAEETVETLKTTGDYKDRTGKYRKSFKIQKSKLNKKTGLRTENIVCSTRWPLTHLLENGHKNRDGKTETRAFPHWKPAEEKAAEDFEKKLREAIRESSR